MNPELLALPALTLRPCWAWLVIRPDLVDPAARAEGCFKDIENRSMLQKYRGRFLIHSGKQMTEEDYDDAYWSAERNGVVLPPTEDLQRGGVIGHVELVDCLVESGSPWFTGRYGFVLRDPVPVKFFPCLGHQGLRKLSV